MTVKLSVALPVPELLDAEIVTVNVPVTDGIPEISPVAVLIVKPVGSPVALKLVGELVAAI